MGRPRRELTPLESYFREIGETPLLTAQQEKRLTYLAQDGYTRSRDLLIRANLRLVVAIARRFQGRGLDLADLIGEGAFGLFRAAERFDPLRNLRFSTYASFWIRMYIRRAILETAHNIRIPDYVVCLVLKWNRAEADFFVKHGRPPTERETAHHMGLSKDKLERVRKALSVFGRSQQDDQKHDTPFLAFAPDSHKPPDVELVEHDDMARALAVLDDMDQRDATVLRMRFGLGDNKPATLEKIGERLGVVKERVRQIETRALAELRYRLGVTP